MRQQLLLFSHQPDIRRCRGSSFGERGLCSESLSGEPGSGDPGPRDGDRPGHDLWWKQLHKDGELGSFHPWIKLWRSRVSKTSRNVWGCRFSCEPTMLNLPFCCSSGGIWHVSAGGQKVLSGCRSKAQWCRCHRAARLFLSQRAHHLRSSGSVPRRYDRTC